MSEPLWSNERVAEWVSEHDATFAIRGERYSVIQTTEAVAVLLQMRDEYEQRIAALEAQLAEAQRGQWQPGPGNRPRSTERITTMIGPHYWMTGIRIYWFADDHSRVSLKMDFFDDGFVTDGSTEGCLQTRYVEKDLTQALNTLIADAKRLGIEFGKEGFGPTLYVEGDGENPAVPLPDNWRDVVRMQCERLGWRFLYTEESVADEKPWRTDSCRPGAHAGRTGRSAV